MVTVAEYTVGQTPLFTEALKYRVAVKGPISTEVNIVEFVPILINPTVNPALSALCH